ncbi:hypothetical protein F3F96_05685 [Mariprofundus sp. NF]|uniref:hypothetical protein n=1 Tax=Mariprofundus sp. NF TaxID=2608716 RepID=UPI0015A3971A|nr:hypothetical protein [Mariprofundus sp. NF]NWF38619.1 hypothetical protein [Mariprofundus sp. NF]
MNKSTGRLFAWANPVTRLNLVDHTWVTDYDVPPIHKSPPPPPDSNLYWWCWGKYHPDGTGGIGHPQHGAIGNASVDLSTASNIVEPNISPKSPVKPNKGLGTIAYYGIDGVCHQVANQTLYATGSKTA